MNRIYQAEEQNLYCAIDAVGNSGGNLFNYVGELNKKQEAEKAGGTKNADGAQKTGDKVQDPETVGKVPGLDLPLPARTTSGISIAVADIAIAIAQLQTEMRKQNRQQMIKETEHLVKTMEHEADQIKDKAAAQFGASLAAGIMTTAAGVVSVVGAGMSFKQLTGVNVGTLEITKAETISQAFGGISKITEGLGNIGGSIGNYIAGLREGDIKKTQAEEQWRQAQIDNLKSFSDGCKEVADKAMNVADTILQSTNQARQKILG